MYCHYNWSTWQLLDYAERVLAVAQYRLHARVEGHINEAVYNASKKKGGND